MKVLQIIGESKFGGSTYLSLEWSKFLLRQGWQVDVLSTDPTSIAVLRATPGVRVISHIYIPREVALMRDMLSLWQLMRFIRREGYTVVHTGMTTSGFVGRLAAWLARTPIIVHDAQGWPVTAFSPLLEKIVFAPLSYLAGMLSTRVICASHSTAAQASEFHTCPRHKLTVICNGIDPSPFMQAVERDAGRQWRKELHIEEGVLVIGNANRLAPQKDNATLIRAMVHLPALLPGVPFVLLLAGDGPERQQLEALVQALALSNQVRLLGFRRDIPAFIAALDIFVNPSLWEGLSISLLEAMAAARPIVTTTIPPNAELISHEETGLLTEPQAPEQIAQAIARFVHDPELARRCREAAQQRVIQYYTIERMLDETWILYSHLLRTSRTQTVSSL